MARGFSRALIPLLSIALLLTGAPLRAEVVDTVLATIDGNPVTLHELRRYAKRTGPDTPTGRDALLQNLITERLMDAEVKKKGIALHEADIDRYVEDVKKRNGIDEKQLRAALQQQGLAWEAYRTQIRRELEKAQLINREIRGKVNVTPEDIGRYYDAHRQDYAVPERFTISQIVLRLSKDAADPEVQAVMKRAQALYQELGRGADFAELARKQSEGPAAKEGGHLGTFAKGEMLDAMEKVVEGLNTGKFSAPCRTPVGVHIIRLDGHSEASLEPVEAHADKIKAKLYKTALEERYQHWLREDLRELHHVEILP